MSTRTCFLSAILLASNTAAESQQVPSPRTDSSAVRAFGAFRQAVSGNWCATIKDWGDGTDVKPIWSDTQRRTFAVTIAREVLEERAIFRSARGEDVVGGVHLFLLDRASGTVHGHGFWPPYADRMIHITGRITPHGPQIEGNMSVFDRDRGKYLDRRMTFAVVSPDSLALQVFDRRADGSEYAREQLFYKRTTANDCKSPPS